MNDWQPIETFPKDGRLVDVWLADDRVPDVYWGRNDWHKSVCKDRGIPEVGICQTLGDGFVVELEGATHWREKPEPPK